MNANDLRWLRERRAVECGPRSRLIEVLCVALQAGGVVHASVTSLGPYKRAIGPLGFAVTAGGEIDAYLDAFDAAVAFESAVGARAAEVAWRRWSTEQRDRA